MSDFIEKVYASSSISANLPMEIEVEEKMHRGRYKSVIHDYNAQTGVAHVGIPIYKSAYIKLPPELPIKIRVYSKMAVYLFNSSVISVGEEGNIKYLSINVPEIVFKVQRRQYVRVPIAVEGFFYLKQEYDTLDVVPKYKFISKDFSAGGMSVVTKKDVPAGTEILINFKVWDELSLDNFLSETVRLIGKTAFGESIYGVRFKNLDPVMEKDLVKFVFRYEIESTKKNRR
ncbi:MAG TPA: flagellar brake domain-containing protein [Petrotogaceae bacterium]|jgi:c-di-GMP-binding flagellar brake protein YcgR|nr:PilZ domain-containing protein [Petrotogaceae bacterium]HNV05339.1 flagellar brake domain-containing protein [Petrotogaceae bacterium]HPG48314.1 flagellar brake domain-containing protein [Petrotogaceae bacterium]HPO26086.1 flagellar brake domain-containing protein [Petrotogaceae bacterium]